MPFVCHPYSEMHNTTDIVKALLACSPLDAMDFEQPHPGHTPAAGDVAAVGFPLSEALGSPQASLEDISLVEEGAVSPCGGSLSVVVAGHHLKRIFRPRWCTRIAARTGGLSGGYLAVRGSNALRCTKRSDMFIHVGQRVSGATLTAIRACGSVQVPRWRRSGKIAHRSRLLCGHP